MKKLPLSIQTFNKFPEEDYLYVDKTKDILKLITGGTYFFISRPRRFGKSLLLSTIKEIFSGNKKLFEGLYIYDKIEWIQYPVVHLDFSVIDYSDSDELKRSLFRFLNRINKDNNLQVNEEGFSDYFQSVLRELSKSGKVAVLIDEYDKPIIDHITDIEKAGKNREVLREFYSALKGSDQYIKFVLITGVSKFSKVSIFSGLNNLKDITLDHRFSSIIGITEKELLKYFPDYIKKLRKKENLTKKAVLEKIKHWYNGYSWDGKIRVYNPFSILNLFSDNTFGNYWFASGTPTFLIKLLTSGNYDISEIDNVEVSEYIFDSYDIENLEIYSLLFQTGYVTIKEILKNKYTSLPLYKLTYPNFEVKESLLNYILADHLNKAVSKIQPMYMKLIEYLDKEDMKKFIENIQAMMSQIPYNLHIEKEAYYHSIFYMILTLMGLDIDMEILTDKGKIDGILELDDKIYVIEFKYGESGSSVDKLTEKAVSQIQERKYYEKFLHKGKRIIFLGIGFADKNIGYKLVNKADG